MAKHNGAVRPSPPENTHERDGEQRATVERESHGTPSHATHRQKSLVFALDALTHTRTPPTTAKRQERGKIEPRSKRGTRRNGQNTNGRQKPHTRAQPHSANAKRNRHTPNANERSTNAKHTRQHSERVRLPSLLPFVFFAFFRTLFIESFGLILYFLLFFATFFSFFTKNRPNFALFTKPPRSPRAPRSKTAVFVQSAQFNYTK